jgi:hypothetical protein
MLKKPTASRNLTSFSTTFHGGGLPYTLPDEVKSVVGMKIDGKLTPFHEVKSVVPDTDSPPGAIMELLCVIKTTKPRKKRADKTEIGKE